MREGIFFYCEVKISKDFLKDWYKSKLAAKNINLNKLNQIDGNWTNNQKTYAKVENLLDHLNTLNQEGELFFQIKKGPKAFYLQGYFFYSEMVKFFLPILKILNNFALFNTEGKAVFISDEKFSFDLFPVSFGFLIKKNKFKASPYKPELFDDLIPKKSKKLPENFIYQLPYLQEITKNFQQWLQKNPAKQDLFESVGKYAYLNRSGALIIKTKFALANQFQQELAIADQGYINKKGTYVLRPKINKKNLLIFAPEKKVISQLFNFSEQLARVELYNNSPKLIASDPFKYGFINIKGQWIIPGLYDDAADFSEGLAKVKINNKFGFIDQTGKLVISLQYDNAGRFSEDYCSVQVGLHWGFINSNGKMVIDPIYERESSFSQNFAPVMLSGKFGYINKKGKYIVKPQFDWAAPFTKDGIAIVMQKNKFGYINKKGKFLTKIDFTQCNDFQEGLARVLQGKKWGYLKKNGDFLIKPQFDQATDFSEGKAVVKIKGEAHLIDNRGAFNSNLGNYDIKSFKKGCICFKQNNNFGLLDINGKIILKPYFQLIEDNGEDSILVKYASSAACF